MRGEVIETDSNKEDQLCVARVQAMTLCKQLAGVVLEYGKAKDIFELSKQLSHCHTHLLYSNRSLAMQSR